MTTMHGLTMAKVDAAREIVEEERLARLAAEDLSTGRRLTLAGALCLERVARDIRCKLEREMRRRCIEARAMGPL